MSKPKPIRRVKKEIGDVIEIPTSKGLAYVQYTHEHNSPSIFGSLIRVLQGFYKVRPSEEELYELVKKPHRFQTFCPVHYGVNVGDWERVGNFPVPDFAKEFPIFKGTNSSPMKDPKDAIWFLWDGEKSWKIGKLSLEEQMKYPEKGVYNDTGLVHAIETGMFVKRKLC
ncbi:MAG: hypothetical protein KDK56_10715 [Simkania sp.]|nr:hypothetical protein [Simkania sp.]MCP5490407.1 hypothetical protein [Chlamydiales bacterium]